LSENKYYTLGRGGLKLVCCTKVVCGAL